jgi:hypothetical protein
MPTSETRGLRVLIATLGHEVNAREIDVRPFVRPGKA